MTWVRTKTPEKENKTEGNGMCQARTREQEGEFSVSGQSTVKSPTQELSGFELSKMWTFVPMSNHINEFTCPAYTVTCQVCAFSTSGGGFVLYYTALCRLGFPGGSVVKKKKICLLMQEMWFQSLTGKIPWRKKRQPTPVFLPGKSHGQRSLPGYSPCGHKESDMAERLNNNNSVEYS